MKAPSRFLATEALDLDNSSFLTLYLTLELISFHFVPAISRVWGLWRFILFL